MKYFAHLSNLKYYKLCLFSLLFRFNYLNTQGTAPPVKGSIEPIVESVQSLDTDIVNAIKNNDWSAVRRLLVLGAKPPSDLNPAWSSPKFEIQLKGSGSS